MLIRFYGALDVACVLYILGKAISSGDIPVYGELAAGMRAAEAFGSYVPLLVLGVFIGGALKVTLVVSGCLMLLLKRSGVFLSLVQAPLRLLLLMPLTFFFVSFLVGPTGLNKLYFVCFAFALEIIKFVTQIYWLRRRGELQISTVNERES